MNSPYKQRLSEPTNSGGALASPSPPLSTALPLETTYFKEGPSILLMCCSYLLYKSHGRHVTKQVQLEDFRDKQFLHIFLVFLKLL